MIRVVRKALLHRGVLHGLTPTLRDETGVRAVAVLLREFGAYVERKAAKERKPLRGQSPFRIRLLVLQGGVPDDGENVLAA